MTTAKLLATAAIAAATATAIACSSSTTGTGDRGTGETSAARTGDADAAGPFCDTGRSGFCQCGPRETWAAEQAVDACTGFSCCYTFTRSGQATATCACTNPVHGLTCADVVSDVPGAVQVTSCPGGVPVKGGGSSSSSSSSSGGGVCGEPCPSGCCSTTGSSCCKPPFCDGDCAGSPCC